MLGELHEYPASTRERGATMTQMEVANRVLPLWHCYELLYLQSMGAGLHEVQTLKALRDGKVLGGRSREQVYSHPAQDAPPWDAEV